MTDITLLCKVVDNYGDIGVVYRLARALYNLDNSITLRIITDNLVSFSKLAPEIDAQKKIQTFNGWRIYDWNSAEENIVAFTAEPPQIILECFQCGRPDWLETLLFTTGVPDIVHIINLEYLTAEPYADDFHCLKSVTRSARVKKVNFMPGFTNKTGGLILDRTFSDVQKLHPKNKNRFNVLIFSYERDFSQIVDPLKIFAKELLEKNDVTLTANVAAGLSEKPFISAWQNAQNPFRINILPFMPQQEWDDILYCQNFLFVRGEDSLSRACLSGIPFIWHAYKQDENYQLVKVQALLDRMQPFFEPETFRILSDFSIAYNTPGANLPDFLAILHSYEVLQSGFEAFAQSLYKNGDLADHLLSYIMKISIEK